MTYTIRPVRPSDLAAVTEVEAICFPAAEAATGESFKARIAAFPECFFVAESEGKIIGFINGCATDSKTICDEMYENSACHKTVEHTSPSSVWTCSRITSVRGSRQIS